MDMVIVSTTPEKWLEMDLKNFIFLSINKDEGTNDNGRK